MLASAALLSLAVAGVGAEACDPGQALSLGAGRSRVETRDRLAVLEDASRALTLEDVSGPRACARFARPPQGSRLLTRGGGGRLWFRFRLDLGGERARDWLLFIPLTNFERACVHWPLLAGGHQTRCVGLGERAVAGTVPHSRLVFTLPDGMDPQRSSFFELESRAPHDVHGELVRTEFFLAEDHRRQLLGGLFNGLLLATVLYNLIFFAGVRDRTSLLYALHLLSLVLAMLALEGHGRDLLWRWLGSWTASLPTALLGATFLFGCLYARDFLMTRQRAKRLDALLRLAMLPALLVFPLSLANIERAEQLSSLAALAFVGSLLTAGIARVRAGDRSALYVLFGMSVLLAGIISVSLRVLGIAFIPEAWGTLLTRAGLVVASATISAGLGRRVGELRRERDRAARAEAAGAEEWRATFDAVDVLVVLLDDAFRVIRLNRAAAAHCGLAFAAAVGRPIDRLAEGELWRSVARQLPRLSPSRTRVADVVRDPAGAKTWELSLIRFTIPATAEQRTAVLARDLTEVARLEESLRRREHMAAMGALVAGVAHEVRNPLFGISSSVDALEARVGRPEGVGKHLETLRSQVKRLGKLMNDLLDYGRLQALERKPEDLVGMVAEASQACDYLAGAAGATVELQTRGELPPLAADRKRIVQVLQNLLENALRHSPTGGAVVVLLEPPAPGGSQVRVAIRDSGPGFVTADLPHVFEPFFTRRKGGTGLGLSIVQQIVEQHGGRVEARNDPAGGAEVVVFLPIAPVVG